MQRDFCARTHAYRATEAQRASFPRCCLPTPLIAVAAVAAAVANSRRLFAACASLSGLIARPLARLSSTVGVRAARVSTSARILFAVVAAANSRFSPLRRPYRRRRRRRRCRCCRRRRRRRRCDRRSRCAWPPPLEQKHSDFFGAVFFAPLFAGAD